MGLTGAAPPLAAWGLSADLTPLPGGHRNTALRTPSGAICLLDRKVARIDAPLFDSVKPDEETVEDKRARLAPEIASRRPLGPVHPRAAFPKLLPA